MDLSGYVAGVVLSVDEVAKKDKLKLLSVNIGADDPVAIVTNAGNVCTRTIGCRVVIAKVGAILKDGEAVKKSNVGGVPSNGMLCDAPMLGWAGGGAGTAVLLPEQFAPGDQCPSSKPRMDGGSDEQSNAPEIKSKSTGPGVDSLFEKKLSKEENKAALTAKRAAKKAAKEGGEEEKEGEEE